MTAPRVLVAGIGNVFLGDDGFGVEVARRLAGRAIPEGIRVVDFGIRGIDLAYALADGPGAAILIDAMPRGGRPGTLYVIEPEMPADRDGGSGFPVPPDGLFDAHGLDPAKVLWLVVALGGRCPPTIVVGCEPSPIDADGAGMELSPPVRAAVDEAATMVESLIARIIGGSGPPSVGGRPDPAPAEKGETLS